MAMVNVTGQVDTSELIRVLCSAAQSPGNFRGLQMWEVEKLEQLCVTLRRYVGEDQKRQIEALNQGMK
jgi:hypothetical protein